MQLHAIIKGYIASYVATYDISAIASLQRMNREGAPLKLSTQTEEEARVYIR